MLKMVSAMLAATILAGALVMVPGLSASANARAKTHKSDRLDLKLRMASCRQMTWPYYDQSCRKDGRATRIITPDRI